jgi:hypothetical protein
VIVVEIVIGGATTGGSATISIVRNIIGSGGAISGGFAITPGMYLARWQNRGPAFMQDDLLLAQRIDYDKDAAKIVVYRVTAKVVDVSKDGEATIGIIDGSDYIDSMGDSEGVEFVRVGNASNVNRQGSVYITGDESGAPFIDVIDGVDAISKLGTIETIKARLGNLTGITDPDFGALTGYGLYSQNAYLKGDMILGPHSSISFAQVTDGPPADATVGADWGSNVTGRPSNLVALGDVPGFIKSTYIDSTEIRAPNITGNSILGGNIVASSGGTNTVGLTGEGSGDTAVRLWAGEIYANRGTAPLRATQGGDFFATKGTIAGWTLSATDLTKVSGGSTVTISTGSTAIAIGPTGAPTFTVTQAGLFTAIGGTFQSAASGKRVLISAETNSISFYEANDLLIGHMYGLPDDEGLSGFLVIESTSVGGVFFKGSSFVLFEKAPAIQETALCQNLNADLLDGLEGDRVAWTGEAVSATGPTKKRTIILNNTQFDVACYN